MSLRCMTRWLNVKTASPPSRLELERELVFRRCARDPLFFISEFVKVNKVGVGFTKFDLWDHQPEIVEWMRSKHTLEPSRSIALKARQVGWTTIGDAFALWSILFHEHHPWLQISVGQEEAAKALGLKVKQPYSMLPAWMRRRLPSVTMDTREEFQFDNGSGITAIPSTSRSGRSLATYGVLFDEAAFMETPEEVFAGIEAMTYGPIFVFSTANGMGDFFHSTWLEAQLPDSLWDAKFFPWSVVPGRTEAWYRSKLLTYRGKEHIFFQEYPASPEEAFLRSGRTAFDVQLLEETQRFDMPAYKLDLSLLNLSSESFDVARFPTSEQRDLELYVYEEPFVERNDDGSVHRKPNYVVGVDVAEGLEHGDFTAISVRDVNTNRQVASSECLIPIFNLGEVLEVVGYWYHTALIVVERNNFGLVPLQYLQEAGYPRLYRMESFAEIKRGDRTPRYGWVTSRATKPKMVQDLAKAFQVEDVQLRDKRFLVEASTFVADGRGGYASKAPNHDDMVMAEMITHQGYLDSPRFPVTWMDPELGPITLGELFGMSASPDAPPALSEPIGRRAAASPTVRSFELRRK